MAEGPVQPQPPLAAQDRALVDRFLAMLAVERGAAQNTLLAYRTDLEGASMALTTTTGLARAGAEELRDLAEHWSELAASTVARKLSALRRFYSFLVDEGERADNPATQIARPGLQRPLPKILTREEVEALFASAEEQAGGEHPPARNVRRLALLELLYGSGLRATELVSLPRNAVHPDRPFLILKGKGGKERLVPVSDRARAAVGRWTPYVDTASPWLFPSG
ncbi:MAG: recombinase XerD, partial [Sphingobium sp. 32-64-5]